MAPRMLRLFLSCLLGAWLLSLIPSETTARSPGHGSDKACNVTCIQSIRKFCQKVGRRNAIPGKLALQRTALSDTQVFLSKRDVDALKIMSEYIPEFQQALQTMLSDNQAFLRKIQHPQERARVRDTLSSFATFCCSTDCIKKIAQIMCYIEKVSQ